MSVLYRKITRLRRANLSDPEIASHIGTSVETVQAVSRERAPGHKLTDAEINRLYKGKRYGPVKS